VELRAARRVEILEEVGRALAPDAGVLARDELVLQRDVALGIAAEADRVLVEDEVFRRLRAFGFLDDELERHRYSVSSTSPFGCSPPGSSSMPVLHERAPARLRWHSGVLGATRTHCSQ